MSESARAGFREKAEFSQDFQLMLRDGTIKQLHVIWHPILDEGGNLAHYIGTAADVTERKRAEEALSRSEAYLTEAQKLTHTGSWAYQRGGVALYWSAENFRFGDLTPAHLRFGRRRLPFPGHGRHGRLWRALGLSLPHSRGAFCATELVGHGPAERPASLAMGSGA